ncbi:MAG: alkane 1-monooxygenase [Bacteroidota bacterium]|nr:alkane 1-monooxygenase [Bacteroidota bacterium]
MPPAFRNLRYLTAYTLPLSAALGLWLGGAWTWLTLAYAFGLVPLLEWLRPPGPATSGEPAATEAKRHAFFDGLLYLNVPLQYGLLGYFLYSLHTRGFSAAETAGAVLSVGICCGALGINVAHELGHRARNWEQRLAQALLLSTWYAHFFIEHNRGHHRHVATPLDPVTARLHESFWRFLPRAVGGEYRSAWALEAERLHRLGQPWARPGNQMLQLLVAQLLLTGAVLAGFGGAGLLAWLGAATVGYVLFQLVNYVEHYGLLRRRTVAGIYERVQPHHSWNSEHALGRILLYELTRHSDHHYQAARPYHTLRHQPASPQMPTGYPGMMLLAAVPPLWFRVMNPRVPVGQFSVSSEQ